MPLLSVPPELSTLTSGLLADQTHSLVTSGLPTTPGPASALPSAREQALLSTVMNNPATVNTAAPSAVYTPAIVQDVNGVIVTPAAGQIALGNGANLSFDPATLLGQITPAFASQALAVLNRDFGGAQHSYTGANCRLMIEVQDRNTADGQPRFAKQLLEASTLSVSVHRATAAVPATGFINTKGWAMGRRTVAGTLICTKFTTEILMAFLQAGIMNDLSKDSRYMKVDQLPPFNISILMSNEYGFASYQRLIGVKFVTTGDVISVQDMMSEQTASYVCSDFTPLLPLTHSSLFNPTPDRERPVMNERTVRDVWTQTGPNRNA